MTSSPPATLLSGNPRVEFIDAWRGIAVALMVFMHTADGWLRPELKHGALWEAVRSLGGLAAPAFFFLAGLGLGLDWGRRPPDSRAQFGTAISRGLQLMVLGYGLRLQMWMIDAGGVGSWRAWLSALPLASGYVALYRAAGMRGRPGRVRTALLGTAAAALGLALVAFLVPDRFRPLLRVDVLQGLGASMALVAVAGPWLRRAPWLAFAGAVAVGVLTPWVRQGMPGPLPAAVAGYLAVWDAGPGASVPTLFPLFPWFAYVPLGLFAGFKLAALDPSAMRRKLLGWSGLGVAIALLFCEPLPLTFRVLEEWPWLTQLVRVGYRVGIVLVLAALAIGVSRRGVPLAGAWIAMGRASLFVYWIHLQLAFGALSRPFARTLEFSGWFLGFIMLLAAMALLARLWLGVRQRLQPQMARVAAERGTAHA